MRVTANCEKGWSCGGDGEGRKEGINSTNLLVIYNFSEWSWCCFREGTLWGQDGANGWQRSDEEARVGKSITESSGETVHTWFVLCISIPAPYSYTSDSSGAAYTLEPANEWNIWTLGRQSRIIIWSFPCISSYCCVLTFLTMISKIIRWQDKFAQWSSRFRNFVWTVPENR